MAAWQPVTLTGRLVTLSPLSLADAPDLAVAAADGRLWELWYTSVPTPEAMADDVAAKLAAQEAGTMLPFVVRRRGTGDALGVTTYCSVDRETPRLEIGYTWTRASAQRTGVNTESKLLLLAHAFEVLSCVAVEFRTHWHNRQSRTAIAALGARQDGVLRAHRRQPDGSLRDTVVFSITSTEWPAVRSDLRSRLARHSAPPSPQA
ncbi:GNAT family N-acetyltransferase [Modestobacter roseus]|uniref:RimJ/RimL family protein N-acetyltransferase n=1 Tax=Modestobacter roseus TaxID=1181884 RepID=A0A562IML1_9ACTN|nr:GNAT family protein [Modestobacter roseus]MQA34113.1 GNAT family N-acetyltransferase [Modestobacter roseus]TWH72112.1 RimJ/RimL family protein N-acetyltransferase [Modestobacter roseus]